MKRERKRDSHSTEGRCTYHITVRITVPTESEPALIFENVQAVEGL